MFLISCVESGTLFACGSNEVGQVGDGTNDIRVLPVPVKISDPVKSVHAGYRHAIAITTNNDLFVWGSSHDRQLPTISSKILSFKTPFKITIPNVNAANINLIVMHTGCWMTTREYHDIYTMLLLIFYIRFKRMLCVG